MCYFSKPTCMGLQTGGYYSCRDKSKLCFCSASFEQALAVYVILELIFWAGLLVISIIQLLNNQALFFSFRTVLVYRFGGTSLDVTVIAVSGGMYRVVATESDASLGGIKLDELLAQHLAAEFQR